MAGAAPPPAGGGLLTALTSVAPLVNDAAGAAPPPTGVSPLVALTCVGPSVNNEAGAAPPPAGVNLLVALTSVSPLVAPDGRGIGANCVVRRKSKVVGEAMPADHVGGQDVRAGHMLRAADLACPETRMIHTAETERNSGSRVRDDFLMRCPPRLCEIVFKPPVPEAPKKQSSIEKEATRFG